jgi:magnesium transporter
MKKMSKKTGLQPGSLVYTGRKRSTRVKINLIQYSKEHFSEKVVSEIQHCVPSGESNLVHWIDIKALSDLQTIEMAGKLFDIHPLVLEDILNLEQRPKIEFSQKSLFVVMKMLSYNEKEDKIDMEQISIVLGKNYVIIFQENEDDIFDGLRKRIRNNVGYIRNLEADYLAYSLMDTIVDYYYILLEKIGQKIEDLEEQLLSNPDSELLNRIYILKRETLLLRKSVWPLREVISKLERADSNLIHSTTLPFIRDLNDHTTIVVETVESYMEMNSNLLELYLTTGNNKLNEVMKILTIISTIFIPLTFIVGIYGMNFKNMPETRWEYGYFIILGIMALIGAGMIWFFRRKKWL